MAPDIAVIACVCFFFLYSHKESSSITALKSYKALYLLLLRGEGGCFGAEEQEHRVFCLRVVVAELGSRCLGLAAVPLQFCCACLAVGSILNKESV